MLTLLSAKLPIIYMMGFQFLGGPCLKFSIKYKVAHGAGFCSSTQLTFIEHQLHAKFCAGYRELLLGPTGLEPTSPVPSPGPFRGSQPPSLLVKYSETEAVVGGAFRFQSPDWK